MASDTTVTLRSGRRVTVPGQLLDVLNRWPAERRYIDQIAAPAAAMLRLSEAKKLNGPEEVAMREYTLAVAKLRASQMQIETMIRQAIRAGIDQGELDPAEIRQRVEAWARPSGLQFGPAAVILIIAAMAAVVFAYSATLSAWNLYLANKAAAQIAEERNRSIIQAALSRNQTPPEIPDSQLPGSRGSDPLDTLAKGAGGALMLLALGAVAFLFLKSKSRKAG